MWPHSLFPNLSSHLSQLSYLFMLCTYVFANRYLFTAKNSKIRFFLLLPYGLDCHLMHFTTTNILHNQCPILRFCYTTRFYFYFINYSSFISKPKTCHFWSNTQRRKTAQHFRRNCVQKYDVICGKITHLIPSLLQTCC